MYSQLMIPAEPEAGAVLRQLQRILASSGFSRNDRLSRFLRFVVERTINGSGHELKETVIATEVFGRRPDYNPKRDATVRIEAGRLRARLNEYYLGEGKQDSLLIEMPKGGYSPVFLQVADQSVTYGKPTQQADSNSAALAGVPPTRRKAPRIASRILWCGAALIFAAGAFVGMRYAHRSVLAASSILPFTSFPGGEYEPAFSPDGARIAFVWAGEDDEPCDLYVKSVSSGSLIRLTSNAAGQGSPAWSPDGNSIAFVRYAGRPEDNGVFVIPSSGGIERKLTSIRRIDHLFASHLDWSPDGKQIAVVDRTADEEPFRIDLVSVETGERRTITHPPAQSAGDLAPRFAPDGQSIVFLRKMGEAVTDLYSCRLADACTGPRRLTFAGSNILSHAWMPGGRELVYSDARGFWRIPLTGGQSQAILGLPGGANFIAASRQGNRLAYSFWSADTNVWRASIANADDEQAAKPIIESTRDDRSAQYSPDGKMIAFRSDRSGSSEIWLCDAEGRNPTQLTSFRGPLTGAPHWSPDGLQVAFDSRPQGNSDIYAVVVASGTVRRITRDAADDVVPSWSSDGRWIYFSSNRTGTWQVWKIHPSAAQTVETAVQVTQHGGFAPIESADGKALYYAKGPDVNGLWEIPVEGGPETPVVSELKTGYWGYWSPVSGSLYFIDTVEHRAAVYAMTPTKQKARIANLPKEPPFGDSGFSVSPDRRWMIYSQIDHSGSDIMLAELR